jgi:hypothetical protein
MTWVLIIWTALVFKPRTRRDPGTPEDELLDDLVTAVSKVPLDFDRSWLLNQSDDERVALVAPARVWKELLIAAEKLEIK